MDDTALGRRASAGSTASRRQAVGSLLRRTLRVAWNGVGAVSPAGFPSSSSSSSPSSSPPSRPFQHGHHHGQRHHAGGGRVVDFVSHQVRSQLSHDLWWLVLAVLVIAIIETRHFLEDPVHWSVFNVVFEVVSAYVCVGITVGVPADAYSFSGGWYPGSKLVLCLVMLRGRHRGLPVALDRAVRLPGDDLRDEDEDRQIRRSISAASARRASFGGTSHV